MWCFPPHFPSFFLSFLPSYMSILFFLHVSFLHVPPFPPFLPLLTFLLLHVLIGPSSTPSFLPLVRCSPFFPSYLYITFFVFLPSSLPSYLLRIPFLSLMFPSSYSFLPPSLPIFKSRSPFFPFSPFSKVAFNSCFNRDTFLARVGPFLRHSSF